VAVHHHLEALPQQSVECGHGVLDHQVQPRVLVGVGFVDQVELVTLFVPAEQARTTTQRHDGHMCRRLCCTSQIGGVHAVGVHQGGGHRWLRWGFGTFRHPDQVVPTGHQPRQTVRPSRRAQQGLHEARGNALDAGATARFDTGKFDTGRRRLWCGEGLGQRPCERGRGWCRGCAQHQLLDE